MKAVLADVPTRPTVLDMRYKTFIVINKRDVLLHCTGRERCIVAFYWQGEMYCSFYWQGALYWQGELNFVFYWQGKLYCRIVLAGRAVLSRCTGRERFIVTGYGHCRRDHSCRYIQYTSYFSVMSTGYN